MSEKEIKKHKYYNHWYVICFVIVSAFVTFLVTSYFEYHQISNSSNFYSAGSNLGTMQTIYTKDGKCAWGTTGNGNPENCVTAGHYLDWCLSMSDGKIQGDPLSWCNNLMVTGNPGDSYASQPAPNEKNIAEMAFQPHYVSLPDNICRGNGVLINETGEITCQDNHQVLGVMPWIK